MINFTETLENYVGNGEEVMLLEKQDTIANLTARLNNRLGG